MKNITKIFLLIFTFGILSSCSTSMNPVRFYNTLPNLTYTKYYNQIQANDAQKANKCKILVKSRTFVAPMGLSVKGDLRKGAKGIDEWVRMDGGNAYVILNYKWVTVDHYGSTQLQIDFDTMRCE